MQGCYNLPPAHLIIKVLKFKQPIDRQAGCFIQVASERLGSLFHQDLVGILASPLTDVKRHLLRRPFGSSQLLFLPSCPERRAIRRSCYHRRGHVQLKEEVKTVVQVYPTSCAECVKPTFWWDGLAANRQTVGCLDMGTTCMRDRCRWQSW